MEKTIKVNIYSIDWDTVAYEKAGMSNILSNYNLPMSLSNYEITLVGIAPDTPLEDIDEGDVEQALCDELKKEYDLDVSMLDWEFVCYDIVKHETKNYYYIWDLYTNEEVSNEDGEPYHFATVQEAQDFIDTDLQN